MTVPNLDPLRVVDREDVAANAQRALVVALGAKLADCAIVPNEHYDGVDVHPGGGDISNLVWGYVGPHEDDVWGRRRVIAQGFRDCDYDYQLTADYGLVWNDTADPWDEATLDAIAGMVRAVLAHCGRK